MKVKGLIEMLGKCNPELEVWVRISYPQNGEINTRAELIVDGKNKRCIIEGWKDDK